MFQVLHGHLYELWWPEKTGVFSRLLEHKVLKPTSGRSIAFYDSYTN